MSQTKTQRTAKRQLGQFLTPPEIACEIVRRLPLTRDDAVLEPSMGDGAFILPLIERFLTFYDGTLEERLTAVLTRNVFGVEIDPRMVAACLDAIRAKWHFLPETHNLICADFFCHNFTHDDGERKFTHIVGNPPFGGTIDPRLQDALDRRYGWRGGLKIKKETYAFFIVKSLELLRYGGRITFICSDTFLTINTMRGLRRLLMDSGTVAVVPLNGEFGETKHPMVVLDFQRDLPADALRLFGASVPYAAIEATGNLSWQMTAEFAPYFSGAKLGGFCVATSGMTLGANRYFLRPIENGTIAEPYQFAFFDDPITLQRERERARLGQLSARKIAEILRGEQHGATRRNVRIVLRNEAERIALPHPDYRYYNKACSEIVYAPPTCAVYWKDAGDAALTFKRNGGWYLHGVGGAKHFGREGITWQLISSRLNARYLPPGYILDSGAPCAFLRDGVDGDELYFILGWLLSPLCNRLLKEVINHTRNIQSKDVERLPYPFWVDAQIKAALVRQVKALLAAARGGRKFAHGDAEIQRLGTHYAWHYPSRFRILD